MPTPPPSTPRSPSSCASTSSATGTASAATTSRSRSATPWRPSSGAGPSALNELAAELYLDKSTASRVVATLERKRYVSRTSHPDDGRAVVLTVTAGRTPPLRRIKRSLLDEEKELLRDFEPEVRAAAAEIMARLARVAASRSGLAPKACCAS